MDALEVLRQMHADATSTIQQIEGAGPEQRGGLWAKLHPELLIHEQIEEQMVYGPVAQDAEERDSTLANWNRRHQAEVVSLESVLASISSLDPRQDQWLTKVREMHLVLDRHIQEEETEIWPAIRQFWGEQKLDQVGTRVQAAKTAAVAGAAASGMLGSAAEAIRSTIDRFTGS